MNIEHTHDYFEGYNSGLEGSLNRHIDIPTETSDRSAYCLGYVKGLINQEESDILPIVVSDEVKEMHILLLLALSDHHIYYPHSTNYIKLLRICERLKSLSQTERKQKDS